MKFITLIVSFLLPVLAFAQDGGGQNPGDGGNQGVYTLSNPIKGVNTITEFLNLVLNNLVIPIGSIVIVLMIIYTGFRFVMARGNPDDIEDARRMLLYVLIGAAILLGATVISSLIGGTLCQIAPDLGSCSNVGPIQQNGGF